jgi:hypothetical protein
LQKSSGFAGNHREALLANNDFCFFIAMFEYIVGALGVLVE